MIYIRSSIICCLAVVNDLIEPFKFLFISPRIISKIARRVFRRFFLGYLCVAISFLNTVPFVYAAEPDNENDKWSGKFSIELKASSDQEIGTLDLFTPVWQQSDQLVFTDIRLVDTSGTGIEGNIGIGLRKLEQDSNYFGGEWLWAAYGFYDQRKSSNDNNFSQFSGGVELFTDNWALRSNAYFPEHDSYIVATSSGTSDTMLNGTTVVLEQTPSLEAREYALPGLDVELGRRFHFGDKQELWLYAGYFYFDRSEVPEIDGLRVRVDYRLYDVFDIAGSEFSIGAEVQHDDIRKTEEFLVARLSIPVGKAAGKNRHQKFNHLDRRMTEYVVRDKDIVSFAEDINKPAGSEGGPSIGAGENVTTVVTDPTSGEELNVFIVDNAGGGDCTQANPCTAAVAQANANFGAGDVIIVTDNTGIVVGNVDLTTGSLGTAQRQLVGGAANVNIALVSGDNLALSGLGNRATLNGTVTLANDASLRSFDLTSTGAGIISNGITNASIDDVNINGTGAAGVDLQNTSGNINISNSSIQNTAAAGLSLNTLSGSFTFTNSTLSNTAGMVFDNVDGNVDLSQSGINLNNSERLVVQNGSSGSFNFGNVNLNATGLSATGIELGGATGTLNFADVDITNLGGITGLSTAGSSANITLASLDISGSGAANSTGVDITGSTGSFTVTNAGTIQNVVTGVELDSPGTGTTNSTLSYQNGTINAGVPVNTIGVTNGTYNFTGSTITRNSALSTATGFGGDLLFVDATGGGIGTSTNRASANFAEINSAAGDIILLVNDGGGIINATNGLQLKNNQQLIGFAAGNATVDFTGSNANVLGNFQYQINDPTGNGAATLTNSGGTEVVTLADNAKVRDFNLSTTGAADGIAGSGFTDATITNMAITNAGADAFDFTNGAGTITLTDSSATNSTGAGLRLNGGNATVALNNFDISDTGSGRSLDIQATTGGSVTFDANSTLSNSGGTGLLINNIGGDITFNGAVSVANATATALQASTLNGNTVAFNSGLGTVSTSASTALLASGGTLNIAGTTTINATGAQALSLSNLTIGDGSGGALRFDTITSTGGANGIQLSNVDASNGFTVNSATLFNNTTAGININGVTGSANITAANIDTAAAGTGVAIAGANGTINIGTGGTGLDIDGGTTGVSINQTSGTVNLGTGASGVFAVDGTSGTGVTLAGAGTVNIGTGGGASSIGATTDTGGTAFQATGGSVDANSAGSIAIASNVGLVSVQGGHSGTLTFSGALSNSAATSATQLNFNNADGTYNFDGTVSTDTTAGTGIGIDIAATSGGTVDFDNTLTIATSSGNAIQMTGTGSLDASGGSLDVDTTSGTGMSQSAGTVILSDTTSFRASSTGTGINASGGTLAVINGAGTAEVISTSGQGLLLSGVTTGTGGVTLDTVNSGGGANGILLNNLNTSNGLTISSATLANNTTAGVNINGTTGTLNIAAANIDTAAAGTGVAIAGANGTINIGTGGTGLDIDGGTTGVSINQTSGTVNLGTGASGVFAVDGTSGTGVTLAGAGTVNIGTGGGASSIGAITDTGGTAFQATGGSVDANYAGSIAIASNIGLVSVQGGHSGTLTFSGALSNSAATSATQLNFNNADGTYNFDGTVSTDTTAGTGIGIDIAATSGGTVDFDNSLIIAAASGSAIQMHGTGTLDVSGGSLDVDTTSGTGMSQSAGTVILSDTTSFRAATSGTGINASGGTLAVINGAGTAEVISTSGQGLLLSGVTTGTGGVILDTVNSGGGANGILLNNVNAATGLNITNATLANNTTAGINISSVSGSATISAANIDVAAAATGIAIAGANGTLTFDNVTINDTASSGDAISLTNATGTVNLLNSSITYDAVGADGLNIDNSTLGAGTLTLVVDNTSFSGDTTLNGLQNAIVVNTSAASTLDATITGNSFTNTWLSGIAINVNGTGGGDSVTIGTSVDRNTFTGVGGFLMDLSAQDNSTVSFDIRGNDADGNGLSVSDGIQMLVDDGATATIDIIDNSLTDIGDGTTDETIKVFVGNTVVANSRADITVSNNTLTNNTATGLLVDVFGNSDANVTVTNNSFGNNGNNDGLTVVTTTPGTETCVTATGNTFGTDQISLTNNSGDLKVPGAANAAALSIANGSATVNTSGVIGFAAGCTIP